MVRCCALALCQHRLAWGAQPPRACRIKEVSDGNKKIPFMLELDSAKWCAAALRHPGVRLRRGPGSSGRGRRLYDSDKMFPYIEDKSAPGPGLRWAATDLCLAASSGCARCRYPEPKLGKLEDLPKV